MRLKSFLFSMSFVFIATAIFLSCSSDGDENEKPVLPPEPVKELTFELKVENIQVHGADLTIKPSDKNKRYIADVVAASTFEDKTNDEIVNTILSAVNEKDLMSGDVMFKSNSMHLQSQTKYVLFALGVENGQANSKLALKEFTTAEEKIPLPELYVSGNIGDDKGERKYSRLTFSVKSDIAEQLQYILIDNYKEGEKIKDENYVEKLINECSVLGNSEQIKTLNSTDGLTIIYDDLEPERDYTFIARVSNTSGAVTKKLLLTTEAKPLPPAGPEIVLVGNVGDRNGNDKDCRITFCLTSPSKDVYYAELIVSEKLELDKILGQGLMLEEIAAANKGNGLVLSDEDINKVNNDVYARTLDNTDGVIPNMEYSCIALVENFMGIMTVARCDVKTEETTVDNTPPTIEVAGRPGDANGNNKNTCITYTVSCTSENASYAEAFVAETSFVNEILQGMTLEDLMQFNAGIGKVLEQNEIDKLNSGKMSLTWDQLLGNTQYSLLFCVKTKGGLMAVERCDVMTEPDMANDNYRNNCNVGRGLLTSANINKALYKNGIVTLKNVLHKETYGHMNVDEKHTGVNYRILPGIFLNK